MKNVVSRGHAYKYTNHNQPVYRGIHPNALAKNPGDYEVGSIGQWPCFSSCTKKRNIANMFSKQVQVKTVDGEEADDYNEKILIF